MVGVKRPLRSTSRLRARRRQRVLIRYTLFFILGVVFLAGVAELTRLPSFTINNIEVEGATSVDQEMIKDLVNARIHENYLYLFSKDNALLYPKGDIVEEILDRFKVVRSLKISLVDFHTLKVTLSEYIPHALFCEKDISGVSGTSTAREVGCYYLTDNGYIYGRAPEISGDAYVRIFDYIESPIGKNVLPQEIFEGLNTFLGDISALKMAPREVSVTEIQSFRVLIKGGGELLLPNDEPFDTVYQNLALIVESDDFKKKVRADYSNLDYIDLRIGNRVFFKVK